MIEGHTSMRFAWLRENSADDISGDQGFSSFLARMAFWAFNAVFWIFLLPFFTPIEYGTSFIAFTVVILLRFGANLYANQVLGPEQYGSFPFRIP